MDIGQIQSLKQAAAPVVKSNAPAPQLQGTAPTGDIDRERKQLRMPRPKKYIRLMGQVDKLSEHDKEIVEAVKSMPVNNKLLGILSECGLGGHIIHAIDKFGDIIAHYRSEDELSDDLRDGYRQFLAHPGCTSVEVYTHTICIIYNDGGVKFIDRKET